MTDSRRPGKGRKRLRLAGLRWLDMSLYAVIAAVFCGSTAWLFGPTGQDGLITRLLRPDVYSEAYPLIVAGLSATAFAISLIVSDGRPAGAVGIRHFWSYPPLWVGAGLSWLLIYGSTFCVWFEAVRCAHIWADFISPTSSYLVAPILALALSGLAGAVVAHILSNRTVRRDKYVEAARQGPPKPTSIAEWPRNESY